MIHKNVRVPPDLEAQIAQFEKLTRRQRNLFWPSVKRMLLLGVPLALIGVVFGPKFIPNGEHTYLYLVGAYALPGLVLYDIRRARKDFVEKQGHIVQNFARRGLSI